MIKRSLITCFLVLLLQLPSTQSSYHYAGCFTHVFYDSFFTSSYMEPTLCFRLCDTPIIYLQGTICRCSGAGLMHHGRQEDQLCTRPCSSAADPHAKTKNTCGGLTTYSAYVEEQFYLRHGHLFTYQINFLACELWTTEDVYDTFRIDLKAIEIESSLNKLEQCAAACLDGNATTKSIAFNDDSDKCLCIPAWKSYTAFQRSNYVSVVDKSLCNLYCNKTSVESKTPSKFACGSKTNSRIWAVYDLNGTCPAEYQYVKEMNRCVFVYKHYWNSCTLPAKAFVYDGNLTWEKFLQAIDSLHLSKEVVTFDFDDDEVVISSSWKCPKTGNETWSPYYSYSSFGYSTWNLNTRYVLVNGCLRETSHSERYTHRLCLTYPLNKYSSTDIDIDDDERTGGNIINAPPDRFCPRYWIDLNGRCYRMSEERKTIQEARNTCITLKATELTRNGLSQLWTADDDDDDDDDEHNDNVDEQLNQTPIGEIVQYASEWQARLGFFLSDAVFADKSDMEFTTEQNFNTYYEDLESPSNETITSPTSYDQFQMIEPLDPDTPVIPKNDSSCVVSTRNYSREEERPLITSVPTANCTESRRVLCETKSLIVREYQDGCFTKPSTLDLPVLISTRLTHELCVSVCREFSARFAVIQLDKCYCINSFTTGKLNLTEDLKKYQQNDCGLTCSGSHHEKCGDENIVVIFHLLGSRSEFVNTLSTPTESNSDFAYDSCIYVRSFDPTDTYQFTLSSPKDIHPRRCLQLCTRYQQNYALLQSNQCLCTNLPLKLYAEDEDQTEILEHEQCSQTCPGSYFYSCGNPRNASVYSMYKLQPKCRPSKRRVDSGNRADLRVLGFEASRNTRQCVHSPLSAKKSSFAQASAYCESLGATIASVNDLSEMQDLLPESILNARLLKLAPILLQHESFAETKYFWFDRTNDPSDNSTRSIRSLDKCSERSKDADEHCLIIRLENNTNSNGGIHRQCIDQSNVCATKSAIPVCIDRSIVLNPTVLPSTKTDTDISEPISSEYNCDDDLEYHFVDDSCYKISFHEASWASAKAECESEGASLFVPEKSTTLTIIKSLFARQTSHNASGFAHVGVIYDEQNRTTKQYISTDKKQVRQVIPDSNTIYDLCEKTFHERYSILFSSKMLTIREQKALKKQPIGCAYVGLQPYGVPIIRCNEIPCNRTATVICQKQPSMKTDLIRAKRKVMDSPSDKYSSASAKSSIARDFAPIFFILSLLTLLILLALISAFYNYRFYGRNCSFFQNGRRNTTNGIYSQLTSSNEFDLN